MRFNRDNVEVHYIDIEPGRPHRHRLEVFGGYWFTYLIDGETVVAGRPRGAYPTQDSELIWWARYYLTEHTTWWDFMEWGEMPGPKFDCDDVRGLHGKCHNGRLKARVRSHLPEGTELHLANNLDRRTLQTNARGRVKTAYRDQSGEHTLLLLDCPQVSQIVECD